MTPPTPNLHASLNVRSLLAGQSPKTELAGVYAFEDLASNGPVHCLWRFHTGDIGIGLRGEVTGMLAGECARCLSPYDVPVCLTINEKLVFSHFAGDDDHDNFCDVIDEDSVVDLADLVRQYLIMEMGEHPHCQQAACACPALA